MNLKDQQGSHQQPAQPPGPPSLPDVNPSQDKKQDALPRQQPHSPQPQRRDGRSRSRSRSRGREPRQHVQREKASNNLPQNKDQKRVVGQQNKQKEVDSPKNASKVSSLKLSSSKAAKRKKNKKPQQMQLSDFTAFLPESMLLISQTGLTSKIRIAEHYQVQIEAQPRLASQYRSLQAWKIWNGADCPEEAPNDDHLWRFKDMLGQKRNEQDLIGIRNRLGKKPWEEVLKYVADNRSELNQTFQEASMTRTSD